MQEFCDEILLNREDLSKREIIRSLFEEILHSGWDHCFVYSFGSTTSGLGTFDSDLDFHIRLVDARNRPINLTPEQTKAHLNKVYRIFRSVLKQFYLPTTINAKVCPIVKLNGTRRGQRQLVTCDLNVTNPFGIYNSIFIQLLCQFSLRFQQMTVLLRYWAKLNELICYGGMNSYTFTMLVIFFLQNCKPEPIFLPINLIDLDFCEHSARTDPKEFRALLEPKCRSMVVDERNQESVFELISQFLR